MTWIEKRGTHQARYDQKFINSLLLLVPVPGVDVNFALGLLKMKPAHIAVVLLIIGCVFGLLAMIWPNVVGGRQAYSDEDALEYQQASLELHNESHKHGPPEDEPVNVDPADPAHAGHIHSEDHSAEVDEDALKAAEERMAAIEAKRNAAITRGSTTASVFKWLAIVALGAGIATHFGAQRSA